MFSPIQRLPADPILGLIEAFDKDPNPNKLDLGVGVYRDENGNTPVLQAVKEAEALLLIRETSKSYIGSHGQADFAEHLLQLVFGQASPALADERVSLTQAPGGTGALRLAADFLKRIAPEKKVWISNPTWPNHYAIFAAAGIAHGEYPYVDEQTNQLDFPAFLTALQQIPEEDVVLLHACCHNPTGFDLSAEQWQQVAEVLRQRRLLPLLDFAYQGFGQGLEQDSHAVRLLAQQLPEVMITASCSKNFGLYRDRVGAFIAVAANREDRDKVRSQLAVVARTNYSNPPAHGSAVVALILGSQELNSLWQQEVNAMRQRISHLRQELVQRLGQHGLGGRFACVAQQQGMFSYSGIQAAEVERLRQEFGIYMVKSGRMNIAGFNSQNLDYFCRAVAHVCKAD